MTVSNILNGTGEIIGFTIIETKTPNKLMYGKIENFIRRNPPGKHWIQVSGDPNAQPSVRELQSKAASDVTHLFFGGNQ